MSLHGLSRTILISIIPGVNSTTARTTASTNNVRTTSNFFIYLFSIISNLKTDYYFFGLSLGEDNSFFFNHAHSLTGNTVRIPMNPFRKIQVECVYVTNATRGLTVFYDGTDSVRDLCAINNIWAVNPSGYRPVMSAARRLQLAGGLIYKERAMKFSDQTKIASDYALYSFALNPFGLRREDIQKEVVSFVAGYFDEVEKSGMKTFEIRFLAEIFKGKTGLEYRIVTDQWANCVKCNKEVSPLKRVQDFVQG